MSKLLYGLCADVHAHAWSQFSSVNSDGVNSRLQHTLDEIDRMAEAAENEGCYVLVFAGDLFHQRGSLDPEVFNPIAKKIDNLGHRGFEVVLLTGNHDLKGKETTELGNAFQSFQHLSGVRVITETSVYPLNDGSRLCLVPWMSSVDKLREEVVKIAQRNTEEWLQSTDLILHAPTNGVIKNMPDHGLDPAEMYAWGFRRVALGHYHNHVEPVAGVFSIGALTHQTWSDVGTKAGHVLVYDDRFTWRASHAPEFVDIGLDVEPEDWPLIVDGAYVRVRELRLSNEEIGLMRAELEGLGAKGVNFQVARETATMRTGGAPATALTLEASLAKYINDKIADLALAAAVQDACKDVLSVVNTAA